MVIVCGPFRATGLLELPGSAMVVAAGRWIRCAVVGGRRQLAVLLHLLIVALLLLMVLVAATTRIETVQID